VKGTVGEAFNEDQFNELELNLASQNGGDCVCQTHLFKIAIQAKVDTFGQDTKTQSMIQNFDMDVDDVKDSFNDILRTGLTVPCSQKGKPNYHTAYAFRVQKKT